ncbi:MAG: hypothetical protein MUC33_01280 [Desulfobacterales bacterium]|jgi:hypothetical protein|nr:hypothetical protein [Desulfobacterales bacterium]MCU0601275.1 hypothetical protein [Desulfobacterales bacterium]
MKNHINGKLCGLALIIAMVMILAGCPQFGQIYKPPETPVCLKPEYAGSVICAIGAKLQLQPEQMHEIIIDATLLGLGTKIVDGPALRKTSAELRKWVVEKDILTMESLYKEVMDKAKLNPAFLLLLQRRLPDLAAVPVLNIKPFLPIDKAMVTWELDQLDSYLRWF